MLLMFKLFSMSEPARGRISEGLTDVFIERTLEFVRTELPRWRDDPERPREKAEEHLNAQLCKYLNVIARHRFPMVFFSHEEKQTGTRKVDISALPSSGAFIGQTYRTIYDPFLVFEGKRLPAPSRSREREYVTGGTAKSGGIQRFKLALHGAKLGTAAMIGYVQSGSLGNWHSSINQWIRELASDASAVEEKWFSDDQLADLQTDDLMQVASISSQHRRHSSAISPVIRIRHFWVVMRN